MSDIQIIVTDTRKTAPAREQVVGSIPLGQAFDGWFHSKSGVLWHGPFIRLFESVVRIESWGLIQISHNPCVHGYEPLNAELILRRR